MIALAMEGCMGHLKVVMDKERSREDRSMTRKGCVFRLAFVVQNDI